MNSLKEVLLRKKYLIELVRGRLEKFKEVRGEVTRNFFSAYMKEQLDEDLLKNMDLLSSLLSKDRKCQIMVDLFNDFLCKIGKEEDCISRWREDSPPCKDYLYSENEEEIAITRLDNFRTKIIKK